MRTAGIIVIALLISSALAGQSASQLPSFDIASIKLHEQPPHVIDISAAGPRLDVQAETVLGLIVYAYDLKGSYQVARTPALSAVGNNMYDIEAEVDGTRVPRDTEFRQMLQSLLSDRFKLQVHHEQREIPVCALVVAKGGPKLKQSAPDEKFSGFNGMDGRNQTAALTDATMDQIVRTVSNFTDRPVVDKTGLTGMYDVKFEATPAFRIDRNPDPHDISILTALPEQLGLKLESEKDMIDVVVVDHVEPPTPN